MSEPDAGTEPLLRIGQLSEQTGVEVSTLRTWEARYGVPSPLRTGGGQRRYEPGEINRVRAMRRFSEAGYQASEAARLVKATWPAADASSLPVDRNDIASLLTEGDLDALRMMDDLVAKLPVEDVIDDVIAPIMREVGERWAKGALSVAEEHAASALVGSWLGAQVRGVPPPLSRTLIVTAAPQGERHELGLAMFGLFLRRQGVHVVHLGSDLPGQDIALIAERKKAGAVCLSGTTDLGARGMRDTIERLRALEPRIPIAVAGEWAINQSWSEDVAVLSSSFREAGATLIDLATRHTYTVPARSG